MNPEKLINFIYFRSDFESLQKFRLHGEEIHSLGDFVGIRFKF